jgi:hypothetical protein
MPDAAIDVPRYHRHSGGSVLIALGGWVISCRPISEGLGVVVLILGIAAFMIHSGDYF